MLPKQRSAVGFLAVCLRAEWSRFRPNRTRAFAIFAVNLHYKRTPASVLPRRNGRSRHFCWENTYKMQAFWSRPLLATRCLPEASQMPPSSPLLPVVSQMASPQERKPKRSFDFFVTWKMTPKSGGHRVTFWVVLGTILPQFARFRRFCGRFLQACFLDGFWDPPWTTPCGSRTVNSISKRCFPFWGKTWFWVVFWSLFETILKHFCDFGSTKASQKRSLKMQGKTKKTWWKHVSKMRS